MADSTLEVLTQKVIDARLKQLRKAGVPETVEIEKDNLKPYFLKTGPTPARNLITDLGYGAFQILSSVSVQGRNDMTREQREGFIGLIGQELGIREGLEYDSHMAHKGFDQLFRPEAKETIIICNPGMNSYHLFDVPSQSTLNKLRELESEGKLGRGDNFNCGKGY